MSALDHPAFQKAGAVRAVGVYCMNSPTRRQSRSAGSGAGGSISASRRSIFSLSRRWISEAATHEGIAEVSGRPATGAGAGTGAGLGAGPGTAGIGVRCPLKGCQLEPSNRHWASADNASFQRAPSQNQLPSLDQPVCAIAIKRGNLPDRGAD